MSRMWLGLAAMVAFIAGRFTAPEAASAEPVVTVKTEKQVETVTVHCPSSERVAEIEDEEEPDDPNAIEAEDTDFIRVLEVESKRIAELESGLGREGALRGQVKDAKTGEHLAGVTVAASIGNDSFAAITDENGAYELAPIPEGTYVVTFYYTDTAVEHRDIAVASRRVTPLYSKIDTTPVPVIQNGITIEEHGHGITITDDYVESITIPLEGFQARTEPSVFSFNGAEMTEDEYHD